MVQQRANKRLRTGAWTLVACLAMTGLTLYLKMRPCCTPGPQPKQPLIDWLVDNGGMVRVHCLPSQLGTSYEACSCMQCCTQAGVAIQAVSAGGLMGTVATQDFKEGDVIMSVSDNLAVELLSTEHTSAVSRNRAGACHSQPLFCLFIAFGCGRMACFVMLCCGAGRI